MNDDLNKDTTEPNWAQPVPPESQPGPAGPTERRGRQVTGPFQFELGETYRVRLMAALRRR